MEPIKSCKTRKLSSLDDWALLKLLDQVPLADLIRLGQVNHRFNQLVKQSYRSFYRQPGRRHLVLVVGSEQASNRNDHLNTITLKQLNFTAIEAILALLPRTISLKIDFKGEILDGMVYLLEGWVDQLVSLELVLDADGDFILELHPLFCLLNRMTQLKELHFKYPNYFEDWDIHLPIISQLQAFSYKTIAGVSAVLDQLCLYATKTLTEINFGGYFSFHTIVELLDVPPHLAIAFKQLHMGGNSNVITFHQLVALCEMSSTLNKLGVKLALNGIINLNRALVMLPNLTSLALYADFTALEDEGEPMDSQQLVPLPTVTCVKLVLHLRKHDDLDLLYLGVVFPNMVKLNLDITECNACKFDSLEFFSDILKFKRRCLKMLQAKGQFGQLLPKLRSVIFCDQILPEKFWKPLPPKTFVQRTASFLRRVPKYLYKLAQKIVGRVLQLRGEGV